MNTEKMNDAMDRGQTAIDAALRSVGSATPASGLEGRILTRLASERIRMETMEGLPRMRWPISHHQGRSP